MSRPIALLLALAATAAAQQPPAVRPLGPVQAVSDEAFGDVVFVRHLATGVLVNDVRGRKVVRLDDMLSNPQVIADSTPATATAYSGRSAALVPYRGDSSLFIDGQSMSMLVVNPAGQLTGRVMSIPRSQDAPILGNQAVGGATFDAAGRLVYRSMPRIGMPQISRPANPGAAGSSGMPAFQMPDFPDSAAIVRLDLASRAVDTVAFIKIPKVKMNVEQSEGRVTMSSIMNPLPLVDDWTVLPDGSVALVRGQDYHLDFVRPDGSRESATKMPFEWRRLTDDDKRAFIDSVKAERERMAANAPAPAVPGSAPGVQLGGAAGGGGQRVMVMGGDGGPPPGGASRAGGPGGPAGGANIVFVQPDELPDYTPPFFAGSARADMDGRIWIRTTTRPVLTGLVYDVVNAKGELLERVQVPSNRTIVGFGAGGVVYLRDGGTSRLERAAFK